MELTDYIRILRKNWMIIVVATLVGLGVASVWSLTRTPLYTAQSTVFVSTQSGGTIAELQQGQSFSQSRVATYASLVTQPIVTNPVIAELSLGTTAAELSSRVEATTTTGTTLITITVTDTDPIQAAEIANALGASLTSAVEAIEPKPEGSETSPIRLTRTKDAQPPYSPSSPNVPLNLALGALIGLALGIGVAVLRSVLDTRIRTPRDVELVTDRPLIGAVAYDPKAKDRPLIVHADPLSPRAESFRALRTNLQFLDMGGRSSFVVTSSLPSEGKSTTTINLAIALADAGKRVALLDTDLRKPKVAEYLGMEGGAGLTDVLIGRARVGDVMLPWGQRSLYVLPAGKIPPNPSELLGSKQMHTLLEVLERDFDVVLCDAPPLLPVTDAAILAKATSGAIIVVAAGRTNRHQLTGAVEALETVGAKIAGVVMSMVPTRGPDSYYTYGYGYGYGYGDQLETARGKRGALGGFGGARRRSGPMPPAPMPVDSNYGQAGSGRAGSGQAGSGQGGPSRVGAGQGGPSRVGSTPQQPGAQSPTQYADAQYSDAQYPDAQYPAQQPQTQQPQTQYSHAQYASTPQQPTVHTPVSQVPLSQQPATEQPATQQPLTQQPVTQQPATQQPSAQGAGPVRRTTIDPDATIPNADRQAALRRPPEPAPDTGTTDWLEATFGTDSGQSSRS